MGGGDGMEAVGGSRELWVRDLCKVEVTVECCKVGMGRKGIV